MKSGRKSFGRNVQSLIVLKTCSNYSRPTNTFVTGITNSGLLVNSFIAIAKY